jgi:hypothetical protein
MVNLLAFFSIVLVTQLTLLPPQTYSKVDSRTLVVCLPFETQFFLGGYMTYAHYDQTLK